MFNIKRREQTIRARTCDAAELYSLAKRADTKPEEIETRLSNLLTSALFACRCYERALYRELAAEPKNPADELDPDELLDRMKGILEFEVPLMLLHTGWSHEQCRLQVKTAIDLQIGRDSRVRELILGLTDGDALPLGETEATRNLIEWALTVVDGVFQAKQHMEGRDDRREHDSEASP